MAAVPPGVRLLVSFDRDQWYRALTFVLTFLLYTSFHLSRKPISIVKSELHKNCSSVAELATAASGSGGSGLQPPTLQPVHVDVDCSWKPFDKTNYKQLLGAMDYSFLCAYAIGMYLSGIIGERLPIRLYLTVGMLSSGLFTCLFGLGYVYNIHSLGFYVFVQVANGLVQTTGWPSVVTCISNWFGKGRRGLIMGLWNSHTSVGNILGSLIAGYWVSSNWGLSFIRPGPHHRRHGRRLLPVPHRASERPQEFVRCDSSRHKPHLDAKKAGDLSTLFDVGGIVGMLLVCGGLVNGPYSLITTAVSADLGTHKSLKGNARALSTVTAIIDGTGSVGGWDQVFYMLMAADFLALLRSLDVWRKRSVNVFTSRLKLVGSFLVRRAAASGHRQETLMSVSAPQAEGALTAPPPRGAARSSDCNQPTNH
ncbi:Glucose-6-phosphate exchanger SLC37A2 [Larimichthys crocea]|uniref:Uncharacterized protein n=1 Tax=Larimichthys crocea TaxID=215358 RepID=A0ACD3QHL1_LARCR|nr:Glucose-6-phosphate exchanger SLC37A2 [Larimichthys crocea]